ncbi:protein phosphatase 1H isoform X3 [Mustela lutreola]|uniref:protein phosphatase 1H isoform X3 n=1 Tax=Mustela lutreola TaxID=9666 RepID=UPI0027973A6A|nr:protein phosphatase 1H isoform X3 [Mustela lutreola]
MLTRVKSAVANFMGGIMAGSSGSEHSGGGCGGSDLPLRFPYGRPEFLGLSQDEVECSADHIARPILILKETRRLPWATGYAEVINAGKSTHNEDQASCEVLTVKKKAGAITSTPNRNSAKRRSSLPNGEGLQLKENSDLQIERERSSYNISGGCTALIVVCLLGKLYVANAGDSRAIIIRNGEIIPMSSEFTPETERQRLQYLAFMQPHLLGNEFTHLEFPRRVQRKELGKKMLYRDFNMTGWKHMDTLMVKRESGLPCAGPPQGAGSSLHLLLCGFGFDSFGNTDGWQEKGSMRAYKTIEDDDLKFPLIYGEGKKARVMATIGVTRGLGDHDLKVHDSNIYIKPFLSSAPEVRVYDLSRYEHGADDVLILATDGLWDVLSNEEVAEAVTQFLPNCDPDDPHRYTLAAQDLVMRARGVLKDRGWRISNDRLGSGDDISVYVIPLIHGNKLS